MDIEKQKLFNVSADKQIAQTILQQLGGNKFLAMTGAKDLMSDGYKLRFKLPKAKDGINFVEITLNGKDLYDVKFSKYRNLELKEVSSVSDVYAENLRKVFTDATGLYTSLGTMGKKEKKMASIKVNAKSKSVAEKVSAAIESDKNSYLNQTSKMKSIAKKLGANLIVKAGKDEETEYTFDFENESSESFYDNQKNNVNDLVKEIMEVDRKNYMQSIRRTIDHSMIESASEIAKKIANNEPVNVKKMSEYAVNDCYHEIKNAVEKVILEHSRRYDWKEGSDEFELGKIVDVVWDKLYSELKELFVEKLKEAEKDIQNLPDENKQGNTYRYNAKQKVKAEFPPSYDPETENKTETEGKGELTPENEDLILEFVSTTPNLDDGDFHAFCEEIGVDKHEAEEVVYSAFYELVNEINSEESETDEMISAKKHTKALDMSSNRSTKEIQKAIDILKKNGINDEIIFILEDELTEENEQKIAARKHVKSELMSNSDVVNKINELISNIEHASIEIADYCDRIVDNIDGTNDKVERLADRDIKGYCTDIDSYTAQMIELVNYPNKEVKAKQVKAEENEKIVNINENIKIKLLKEDGKFYIWCFVGDFGDKVEEITNNKFRWLKKDVTKENIERFVNQFENDIEKKNLSDAENSVKAKKVKAESDTETMTEELEKGKKVETEHGATYQKIKDYYKEHETFPPMDMVTGWIATDHLTEFKDYYDALDKMEKELKAEKKEDKKEAFQKATARYSVRKQGNKWVVWNKDTNKSEGESDTEEKAQAHMRALYANAPKDEKKKTNAEKVENEKPENENNESEKENSVDEVIENITVKDLQDDSELEYVEDTEEIIEIAKELGIDEKEATEYDHLFVKENESGEIEEAYAVEGMLLVDKQAKRIKGTATNKYRQVRVHVVGEHSFNKGHNYGGEWIQLPIMESELKKKVFAIQSVSGSKRVIVSNYKAPFYINPTDDIFEINKKAEQK